MTTDTLNLLKEIFSEVLLCTPEELKLDKPYVDMGVDSILAIQISKLIQIKFNKKILSSELYNFISIVELASYIDADNTKSDNIFVLDSTHKDKKYTNIDEKIAIVGIAGRYPKSRNIKELWRNLVNNKNTASSSSQNNRNLQNHYFGCFLDNIRSFDNDFFNISPKEAKFMDPQQRIMLEVAFNAFEDAGITIENLNNSNCGVITTSLPGDYKYHFTNETKKYSNFSFLGNAVSVLSGRISHFFNLKGPCLNIDTACSSSLVAIDIAVKYLLSGESDTFLVGASSIFSTEELFRLTKSVGIIAENGICSPFDDNAQGFVPAESVSCIVLKRISDVDKNHDKIYGIIEGILVNHDGFTNGIMSPNYIAHKVLITDMYNKNNIDVSNIALVECHGTGTRIGDPIEIKALKQAYDSLGNYACYLNSCKANIGHSLVASGLTSVVKVLMCFEEEKIPKQINFSKLNSEIDLGNFSINTTTTSWPKDKKFAAISAFGFSGTNAHLVLSKPERANKVLHKISGKPFIFLFTALDNMSLDELLKDNIEFLNSNVDLDLESLSYSLNCRKNHCDEKILFIADSIVDLKNKIQSYLNNRELIQYEKHDINLENVLEFLSKKSLDNDKNIYLNMLEKLATEILSGKKFNISSIYSPNAQKISLPEYKYKQKEFWVQSFSDVKHEQENVSFILDNLGDEVNEILRKMLHIISKKLDYKIEEIPVDKSLSDLGVDSIIALQILENFKTQYEVNDSSIIFDSKNIVDLSSKIFNLKKEQNSKTFLNNSSESHFSFKNIQYKTIIDKNIEWVIFGTGFNKNIILLPPLNTLFHVWIQQIKLLTKLGYKIYIPHYPGHSNSNLINRRVQLSDLSKNLIQSFSVISNNCKNINIIGWSLGGCLGILAALQNQILINKLMVINCLPKFDQDIFGQSLKLRDELLDNRDYLINLYGDSKDNISDFISAHCNIDILKEYYNELQEYDVTHLLSKITTKTLVIIGEEDPVIEVKEVENFKKIKYSSCKLIKNGGHFIPLIQPFLFNRLLKDFLEELDIS